MRFSARSIPLLVFALAVTTALRAQADAPSYAPGDVLIKFRDAASAADRDRVLRELRATDVRELGRTKIVRAHTLSMSVDNAMARYHADPSVETIEPNYILHAD